MRSAATILCALLALASGSCGARTELAVEAEGDAGTGCVGHHPSCTLLYGDCCGDIGFSATCLAGEWVCDPCVLGDRFCEEEATRTCDKFVFDGPAMGISPDIYCNVEL